MCNSLDKDHDIKANGWCSKGLTKHFDVFTGATKYRLPLILKVGLDNVCIFERYAERVVCRAIHHQKRSQLYTTIPSF